MTSIIVMVLTVLVLAAVCTWLWLMDVVDRRAARRVAELEYLLSSKPLQPRPFTQAQALRPTDRRVMKLINDVRTNFLLCLIWFLLLGGLWHNTFFGCFFYGFMIYEAINYTAHLWHTRKETTDVPT